GSAFLMAESFGCLPEEVEDLAIEGAFLLVGYRAEILVEFFWYANSDLFHAASVAALCHRVK
ncbi:MAG: hypothetical protein V3S24_17395, partial [Candidatus Tectomicrobia bacterium]